MIDEDFSLGNTFDNDEYSLPGNKLENEEYSLSGNLNKKSTIIDSNDSINEIQRVYDILHIKDRDLKLSWEDFFKQDAGIFILLNKTNFQLPTKTDIDTFSTDIEKWIHVAHKEWIDVENQHKTELLTEALQAVLKIYTKILNSSEYAQYYIKEIRTNLKKRIDTVLDQKIKDGILEISEIQEIYEIAVSINLVSDSVNGKKAILNWINKKQEKKNFIIESFSETFIRNVKENKTPFERFNTDICKKNLFDEYKNLALLNHQLTGDSLKTDKELFEEMYELLVNKNLFIDNVQFYKENFFEKEKQNFQGNFALPHNDEDFYYYKGTAKNLYYFTEEQWNEFVRIENLRKEDDASVAFIMGTAKAVTLSSLATLLEENPNMALSRIRAGDVETYLSHIGQLQMANMLSAKKEELKNDTDLLVQAVVSLLRGADFSKDSDEEEEVKETDSLIPLIERKATPQEIVSYLLRRKQFEKLNKKILSNETNEHKELEKYLFEIGFTFQKICLNYLNEFLDESNATVYKNMYEIYARYILNICVSKNDAKTFLFVLKPLLLESKRQGIISDSFMNGVSEQEKSMLIILADEEKSFIDNQNKKSKKSIFGFKK